jgi:hypothetical protein
LIPAFSEGVFGETSPTSAPDGCPLSFIASASSGVSVDAQTIIPSSPIPPKLLFEHAACFPPDRK